MSLPNHTESPFDVLWAMRKLVQSLSSASKILRRDTGLTIPQVMCLKAISDFEGDELTLAELSRRIRLSNATTSRIVQRLVQKGLINRSRSTIDRRRIHLTLTPTGEARVTTLPNPFDDAFLARWMNLSANERQHILGVLEQIGTLLDEA